MARKDREANRYGGVIIAAKDNTWGTALNTRSTSEIVEASFKGPDNIQLIICSTYRPPSSDLTYMENLCTGIKQLNTENKNATIWIAGDLILPDIDWTSNSVVGSNYTKSISQCMLDTIYDTSPEQIVFLQPEATTPWTSS